MIADIIAYARERDMLEKGDGIVVGVSGGADSMCLLRFLLSVKDEYSLRLLVLHVNHGIRGASADADERFVADFCEKNGVAFRCVRADIPGLARSSGRTEEETGREVRYDAFRSACRESGYNKVAVAHNLDDNAETVLFNMFRGSGISGIRGITPKRELEPGITLIRPLLGTSRAVIEQILAELGQDYRTDETNLGTEYSRNMIRNELLPYVREKINVNAAAHIAALAEQAGEAEEFLGELVDRTLGELEADEDLSVTPCGTGAYVRLTRERLSGMSSYLRRAVLRKLLITAAGRMKDIESVHVDTLCDIALGGTGRSADLPYGLTARASYGDLIVEEKAATRGAGRCPGSHDTMSSTQRPGSHDTMSSAQRPEAGTDGFFIEVNRIPGEYELPDGSRLAVRILKASGMEEIPKNNYTKWFDYDKISGNICVRTRRDGDYLLTAGGRKPLNRYFIDTKTDRTEREKALLLTEGDHVMWVIGKRRDDSHKVTEKTGRILSAEIIF